MTKYYTKEIHGENGGTIYHESDIGWRWCKDELPEKEGLYLILDDKDAKGVCWFSPRLTTPFGHDDVVQWCKLMPPLEAEEDTEAREYVPVGFRDCHECKYIGCQPKDEPCNTCDSDCSNFHPKHKAREYVPLPVDITPENMYKDKARRRAQEVVGVPDHDHSKCEQIDKPTEPTYDEQWWKDQIDLYGQDPLVGCQFEEHYQKTLERIKHDLKIGGGE